MQQMASQLFSSVNDFGSAMRYDDMSVLQRGFGTATKARSLRARWHFSSILFRARRRIAMDSCSGTHGALW